MKAKMGKLTRDPFPLVSLLRLTYSNKFQGIINPVAATVFRNVYIIGTFAR